LTQVRAATSGIAGTAGGDRRVPMFSRLWRADWHLSALLGLLLLVVFVLYPMSGRGPLAAVLLQLFLSFILISGSVLIARTRRGLGLVALFVVGIAAAGWIRLGSTLLWLTVLSVSMWIVFLGMLTVAILVRVFEEGKITVHRIQGAVAAYFLLGVMWSGCYRLVMAFDPGAFNLPAIADEGTLMSKLVYFSFATLTTVGYGDVTAVDTAARSLAMLEALVGQLFPAVLLARLVSMEASHPHAG
jgi:Ion channel